MKNAYCTIITGNYLPYAEALLESLVCHAGPTALLYVLVADGASSSPLKTTTETDRMRLCYPDQMPSDMALALASKYRNDYMDGYRWAMKPVFMIHLLQESGLEKVLYLDSDLFFFDDPRFLFELLDAHRMILTPHWRCADRPEDDPIHFRTNFLDGIYNAGFVGARRDAVVILRFWANLCRYACTIRQQDGYYVDQKYLDILHSRFEGVGVVRHRGCNVSDWNRDDCKRTALEDGRVVIHGHFPIVFIHFTTDLMASIIAGVDPLLQPHFIAYARTLQRLNPAIDLREKAQRHLQERRALVARQERQHKHPLQRLKRLLTQLLHPVP